MISIAARQKVPVYTLLSDLAIPRQEMDGTPGVYRMERTYAEHHMFVELTAFTKDLLTRYDI